jgi:DNA-binding NtrC family response regulator
LVLLDIKMPKMDGIEVLKRIKKIDKDLVVVMITGYGALDTAKEAMKLGAYEYVTKPFDLDFIKAVIRDVLSERKSKRVVKRTR